MDVILIMVGLDWNHVSKWAPESLQLHSLLTFEIIKSPHLSLILDTYWTTSTIPSAFAWSTK